MTSTIKELHDAADRAQADLIIVCQNHGYTDHFDAWVAEERNGAVLPEEIQTRTQEFHTALHAYYLARDGKNGVLGRKVA